MSLIKTSLAVAGVVAIVGSVVLYNKNPELFSSLTSGFSGSSSPNAVSAKKADPEKETRDLTADPEGYLTKARKSADKSLARMKELEAARSHAKEHVDLRKLLDLGLNPDTAPTTTYRGLRLCADIRR